MRNVNWEQCVTDTSSHRSTDTQQHAVMKEYKTIEPSDRNSSKRTAAPLVGVGYPPEFLSALDNAVSAAISKTSDGALLVLSIDNLSMILSAHGHTICEDVMLQLGNEIAEIIGITDAIHRIQRDQFGIIVNDTNEEEVRYLAERIISHIQHFSCYAQYGSLHVTSSIASIHFPKQAKTAHDALDKSFIALHEGDGGVSIRSLEREMDLSATSRQEMGLANYLNKAIRENRLQLAYQPIISSKTGEISHYEALLRMRTDDGKITSAGALVPIAERMGLIDLIDDFTLRRVIEELRQDDHVKLAFNISNLTTKNAKWLEDFTYHLQETPHIAPRLIVEITETAAQLDLSHTAYFVAEIQAMGCMVALDDFGSGYTSFRQLKTLSVDMVKIDGAFIKDLVDNADNRFFVKTLLDFTKGFGLESVAEFVENGEIAKILMELGVEYQQGYYFGRPENHRSWLKSGEYDNR